jgi:hypothetical protein
MIRPNVPLHDLDVRASTNLPDQGPHFRANLAAQHRLAILRDEHEMVVQRIHGVGGSTVLPHGRPSYRKPPEGVA